MKKIGFDNEMYIEKQTEQILKRISQFDNKLYLEFGGKLFDDFHASRVLPGFGNNSKIMILQKLASKAEIIFAISAIDIENNKVRADSGLTYDMDVMRLIDEIRKIGLYVSSVVITQFASQSSALEFKNKLTLRGEKVYIHRIIEGYPSNVDKIVSNEGYGSNDFIETTRPLVVVTAPGPGSGKMATCLSQLYHEFNHGVKAGYAKYETFPIWNLPLKHPVNLAYEAATADLKDVNMIDPFHLDAYNQKAVNYNRDIDIFPVVKTMLTKITGDENVYKSPTDMGVNMAGYCIIDDEATQKAACDEIIRRYYKVMCDYKQGKATTDTIQKIELILNQINLKPDSRLVVKPALLKSEASGTVAIALELQTGEIITGKTSNLLSASSALILNAIKKLSNIDDEMLLLSPIVIEPIIKLKQTLKSKNTALNLEETLISLSICAATNPIIKQIIDNLGKLKDCEAHSSNILGPNDTIMIRKLGINLTCEPEFSSKDLYEGD
ncbi:MAG: DUF1846 domain-containing protein [Clostridia bacterium]